MLLFMMIEIIAVALDGVGLFLISRGSIAFMRDGNNSGDLMALLSWGMGVLVLKGLVTAAITYRTYQFLVLEETRIASENYRRLLAKSFDSVRNEPYSSYFDVVQQSPQVMVHTIVLNTVSILVSLSNI